MRTFTDPKFRIKVEEKNNGDKVYYPQMSLSKIGILGKRSWIGICTEVGNYEKFNPSINYPLNKRNCGFYKLKVAMYLIKKWHEEIKRRYDKETKNIYYFMVDPTKTSKND